MKSLKSFFEFIQEFKKFTIFKNGMEMGNFLLQIVCLLIRIFYFFLSFAVCCSRVTALNFFYVIFITNLLIALRGYFSCFSWISLCLLVLIVTTFGQQKKKATATRSRCSSKTNNIKSRRRNFKVELRSRSIPKKVAKVPMPAVSSRSALERLAKSKLSISADCCGILWNSL